MLNAQRLMKFINTLNVCGIAFILLAALVLQIALYELPCPLCLLQRLGLLGIAFGFLLNVHYRIHPGHYALVIMSAFFAASAAMRQMVMDALPPHGYGFPVFGLHLYTWVFIMSAATIFYTAIIFSIPGQYKHLSYPESIQESKVPWVRKLGHLSFAFLLLMIIGNAVSTYFECGFTGNCSNDDTYKIKLWHG